MKKQRRKTITLLVTGLLSGAIIIAGLTAVTWIDRLIPTYKNEVVDVEELATTPKMIRRNQDINHSMFPWNLYDAAKMDTPTDALQAYMLKYDVEEYMRKLFYNLDTPESGSWKESFASQRAKPFQSNPERGEFAFLKDQEIYLERENETYTIDCAVQQDAGVLYYHKQKLYASVTKEQMEQAYLDLLEIKNSTETFEEYDLYVESVPDLLLKTQPGERLLNYLYTLYEKSSGYDFPIVYDVIGQLIRSGSTEFLSTSVITTEREVLLIFTLLSGPTALFFYDPISQDYMGYSIQYA